MLLGHGGRINKYIYIYREREIGIEIGIDILLNYFIGSNNLFLIYIRHFLFDHF